MKDNYRSLFLPPTCITSDNTNKTRKIKKITLAISADAAAMPVKPRTAAIMAIMRNVNTQSNIVMLPVKEYMPIKFLTYNEWIQLVIVLGWVNDRVNNLD